MELPRPRVLIPDTEIDAMVTELAERISLDYTSASELVLIGVLKGAFIFLADLSRRLSVNHMVDFIALSSYGTGTESSGAVRLLMDMRVNIQGRHALIIEDIVDRGHTLAYLVNILKARGPASLKTCALVRKPVRHEVHVELDYVGFTVPDEWVVGYGLDYKEQFRTLPYIGVVREAP